MKLFPLLRLSHAEFIARRKTIILSILAASIPIILMLGINFLASGVESLAMQESNRQTNGDVYLITTTPNLTQITQYGGVILHQFNEDDVESLKAKVKVDNVEDFNAISTPENLNPEQIAKNLFLKYSSINSTKLTAVPSKYLLDFKPNHDFNPLDLSLDKVQTYHLPDFAHNTQALIEKIQTSTVCLVKFPNVQQAYNFVQLFKNNTTTPATEVFSNNLVTYRNFRYNTAFYDLLKTTTFIIIAITTIGTFVYLLDQDLHAMVIYRALGATTKDLLIISLGFLLEISWCLILCSLMGGMMVALGFSLFNLQYLTDLFTKLYGVAPIHVVLLGWNKLITWTLIIILASAPVSLLLMIDQFSTKRLAHKLKRE